jgi:hypothetical protein
MHNESHLQISAPKNEPLWQKKGGGGKLFTIFFALFRFFGIFIVLSHCLSATSVGPTPPKKIMPKNLP